MHEGHRKWWVLAASGAALAAFTLDETVVGVALPSIRDDLGMSEVAAHWVVNAYLLVLAGFVAAAGRLADIFGLRRVFVTGAVVFGLASLACGLAQEPAWLVAARAVQGLGAAMLLPTSLAIVTTAFPVRQRGLALGVYVACGGAALALGPVVGGGLVEALSWRWIFFVNLPVVIAVIAIIMAVWQAPDRSAERPPIDVPGFVVLVVGLSGIVLALMQGSTWGWDAPATIGSLILGVLALALFWARELRAPDPLIEVRLFRSGTFTGSNLAILTGQMAMSATVVFLALYLQDELGLSPFVAGLALFPGVVATIVSPMLAGRASDRFGPRLPTLAGLAGLGIALLGIAVATTQDAYWPLVPALVLWGSTIAFTFTPPQSAIMTTVTPQMQGEAGGISRTAQMIGGTIGIAVFSAILSGGGDFAALFAAAAAVAFVVLAVAWLVIDPSPPSPGTPTRS